MDDVGIGSIVLSVAFSWVLGLTPPLLIRFVFLREPIGHWPAVGICSLFWAVNFVLSSAIGSTSGRHGALLLVALAAYWILRTSFSPHTSRTRQSPRSQGEAKTVARLSGSAVTGAQAAEGAAPGVSRTAGVVSESFSEKAGPEAGAAANVEGFISDEQWYAMAFEELNSGQTLTGLWAKCFAEVDGDENKTKAKYLATRSARLKVEHQMRSLELAREARALKEMARMAAEAHVERAAESGRRGGAQAWSVNRASMEDVILDAVDGALDSIPKARRKDADRVREAVGRAARAAAGDAWGKKPICKVMVTVL